MDACINKINKNSAVCSRHFSCSHFKWTNGSRKILETNAVPSLFLGEKKKYIKR